MRRIGIIGSIESGLERFLQFLVFYFDSKYIRTLQTKTPYVLMPTSLCTQIRTHNPKSNSLLQKKWNGILIFKNLESNQEMFEMLIGDMSDTPNQVSTVALTTLNSDPLKEQTFFNIGDFAGICSEVFILISCLHPLEKQLKQIPLLHFKNKKYHIYIMNSQEFPFSKRQEIISSFQMQITRFFLEHNLNLSSVQKVIKLDTLDFCAENNEIIIDLFQKFQEIPILLQKHNNEYIFRLCCIHDESVNSSVMLNQWENRNDGFPPSRGVDIHIVNRSVEENRITLQIFDLMGTMRWRFIAETFMSNCKGYFLVYDLARPESQHLIQNWVEIIETKTPRSPILIIGLKNDLLPSRNNSIIEKEWLISHPLILDHFIFSIQNGAEINTALDILLEKIIAQDYIIKPNLLNNNNQLYMHPLENRKIYQELLQIFEINHKVSADVFTDLVIQYFKGIPDDIIHHFFIDCLNSTSDIERFYALFLIRYWSSNVNRYFSYINHLFTNPNTYYRYFILSSFLIHTIRSPELHHRNEFEGNLDPIVQIEDFIHSFFYSQNNSMLLDIDTALFFLILKWIPYQNLSEGIVKEKLNLYLVHFCSEIRKMSWDLLHKIDSSLRNQSFESYLKDLSSEIKTPLINILSAQLNNPNIYLKKNAIEFFGLLHDTRAIWSLITALIQKDDSLKKDICEALYKIDPVKFSSADYHWILKGLTAEERGLLSNLIQERLLGPDDAIRLSSIKLLYDLKDPLLINPFIIALNDAKDTIQFIAIQALGEYHIEKAIVPLLDCYIHSGNEFSQKEILQSIHRINPDRFQTREYKAICLALTVFERSEFIRRLIQSIQRSYDEHKRLSLIRYLCFFNEPIVLKLLIELMRDNLAQIQNTARQNLITIARLPYPHNIHDPEQINLFFRGFDDFLLFSQINFEEYITTFSWQQVMKALLYTPLTETNRLYGIIPAKFHWNLEILYRIRKMSFVELFCFFLNMNSNEINQKTILNYIALGYPYSYDFLLRYIREHSEIMSSTDLERLKNLATQILHIFTLSIPMPSSDPNDINAQNRNILL